ncbi:MAG: DUF2974 domain-containing protein [Oscillospiraceae bacterium]|nr:DUF2974 domain-containing protein [Oscillospiraceae bacterium]
MANTYDYIRKYGNFNFSQMPFNDIDSVCLCHSFYLPVESVYRNLNGKMTSLKDLYMKTFELRGSKHKAVGLILSKHVSIEAVEMARSGRFGEITVADVSETFLTSPAVQFAAMTLLLDNGTTVIVYRGTDDSIIGWKEDLDILAKKGIPSHNLAADYLNRAAEKYDGDIIICGHSKGGNLALWAALNCEKNVRSRIKGLYNLEGPGFYNYHLYGTNEYAEIKKVYHHLIPQSAFVGVMLAHDEDYSVIKSNGLIGPIQHDLHTWLTQDDSLIYLPELSFMGKINDAFMKKLIELVPEEYYGTIEKVADNVVKGLGELYLVDFVKNISPSLKGAVKAWRDTDADMRNDFKNSFKGTGKAIGSSIKETRAQVSAEKKSAPATVQS